MCDECLKRHVARAWSEATWLPEDEHSDTILSSLEAIWAGLVPECSDHPIDSLSAYVDARVAEQRASAH